MTIFLKSLEKTLNLYLKLDPSTRKQLYALQNATLKFHLTDWNSIFFIVVLPDGLSLKTHLPEAQVSIETTLTTLIGLKRQKKPVMVPTSAMTVMGNPDIAQGFQELFRKIDIDWEAHLATRVGDVLAHGVMNRLRSFKRFTQKNSQRLQRNLQTYLQIETQSLPLSSEVEAFFEDIFQLQHDVDRLESKINRLCQQKPLC